MSDGYCSSTLAARTVVAQRSMSDSEVPTTKKLKSILLVDDVLAVILAYKQFLRRHLPATHSVSFVTSGSQALMKMKRQHFTVVFMDLSMPDMRGEECIHQLREWEKEVGCPCRQQVIALYDVDRSDFKSNLISLGFDSAECKGEYRKHLMRHAIIKRVGQIVQFEGHGESGVLLSNPIDNFSHLIDKLQAKEVLVVDDDASIRQVHKSHLEEMGLTVQIAKNGKEALQLMKAKRFLAVFSDIDMPVMNGKECITQLREYEKTHERSDNCQFVIAVSTCEEEPEEVDKKLVSLGFDGAVTKATPKTILLQTVRDLNLEEASVPKPMVLPFLGQRALTMGMVL